VRSRGCKRKGCRSRSFGTGLNFAELICAVWGHPPTARRPRPVLLGRAGAVTLDREYSRSLASANRPRADHKGTAIPQQPSEAIALYRDRSPLWPCARTPAPECDRNRAWQGPFAEEQRRS
jgi:hypothetical protein